MMEQQPLLQHAALKDSEGGTSFRVRTRIVVPNGQRIIHDQDGRAALHARLEQQHVPVRQPLLQQQSSSHLAGQQQPSLQQSSRIQPLPARVCRAG